MFITNGLDDAETLPQHKRTSRVYYTIYDNFHSRLLEHRHSIDVCCSVLHVYCSSTGIHMYRLVHDLARVHSSQRVRFGAASRACFAAIPSSRAPASRDLLLAAGARARARGAASEFPRARAVLHTECYFIHPPAAPRICCSAQVETESTVALFDSRKC